MNPNPREILAKAVACHQRGEFSEAERLYRHLLTMDARDVNALHLLGVVLAQQRRFNDAIPLLENATKLAPSSADVAGNLGSALRNAGRPADAVGVLNRAVQIAPGHPIALGNLGLALLDLRRFEDAAVIFRRAVAAAPGDAGQQVGLGHALKSLGRHEEAMAAYTAALRLKPNHVDAMSSLGHSLWQTGRNTEAAQLLRQAIAADPACAAAHHNLALVLHDLGDLDEAMTAVSRALALFQEPADIAAALGDAASLLKASGRVGEALVTYRRALAVQPSASLYSNMLFAMQFDDGMSPEQLLAEHQQWAQTLTPAVQAKHTNDRSPGRRIRVGYVSPDFCDHCQAFFLTPLLAHHDHNAVEVFCYSDVRRPDAVTARLRGFVHTWRETKSLSDDALAQLISADRVDVLVDLTMHMAGNRLPVFARRPAPVQMTWLAYPGTTGAPGIDFRLTDPNLDPPGNDRFYSETSIRLPETFWCYDPITEGVAVADLPARSAGHLTFGCLNNFCKVTPSTLRLWKQVLAAAPDARMVLHCPRGWARENVLRELSVVPARIDFVDRLPRREYLELYRRIDLGLDTIPYNGHTTSLDALWMGVPVLTLVGQRAVARAGFSQLRNLEMTEFVTYSEDEFVAAAAKWAATPAGLAEIRAALRGRMQQSPLMDARRFAAAMEAAYRQLFEQWRAS